MISNYPEFLKLIQGDHKNQEYRDIVLKDLWICLVSREVSLMARREVLTGKAKFGITGDGKELAQVAMAKVFQKGDFRAGYYRDQTLMFALGISTVEDFFAQLYADAYNDPFSGGRQMNSHYATPYIDEQGDWLPLKDLYNSSADLSCTAGQMGRALGLALASKKYRELEDLIGSNQFSNHGDEVCFCTIGDSSTSEGAFWETLNSASVNKVPLSVSVWDDGYGISVPVAKQTTKSSISKALKGFKLNRKGEGIIIKRVKAYDYLSLCQTYESVTKLVRNHHIPALIHVTDVTQPQGHSTSGSHERYKDKSRLNWEKEKDCIEIFINWILKHDIADTDLIKALRSLAKTYVRNAKLLATSNFTKPTQALIQELVRIYRTMISIPGVSTVLEEFKTFINPTNSEVIQNARRLLKVVEGSDHPSYETLRTFVDENYSQGIALYKSHLYVDNKYSALKVPAIDPIYSDTSPQINGYQILNQYFRYIFEKDKRLLAFGEDLGKIGDVNQGFAGLQTEFGEERIFDTGIREWSIVGKAIGLAMRGFRPIAEIQYLDYLVYALAPLTDDLASLRYRSNGIQQAPAIIRTRGHRLEGIWHSGSPMSLLLSSLRGMYIAVPRNMVQAAGLYNTLLRGNDPGIVIECLNGYRIKERLPDNIGEYCIPLGSPEVLIPGSDLTLVTYGSCVRVAQEGLALCKNIGISIELIDIQTLLPFDLEQIIVHSLKKTSRIIFMDEDIPGGATSFMMNQVIIENKGFMYLDAPPRMITATENRPPYGSDGDYYCKPNPEDVVDAAIELMAF